MNDTLIGPGVHVHKAVIDKQVMVGARHGSGHGRR